MENKHVMMEEELKQRLIELLYRAHHNASCVIGYSGSEEEAIEEEANYLIANGVTIREHGEWLVVYQNKQAIVYECSKCHHLSLGTSDYCICGAEMRGVKDE